MDETPKFTGVVADPRSTIEVAQDFQHAETMPASGGGPVVFPIKDKSQWRMFKRRFQTTSSSCMAHSGVKMLGIENSVEEGQFAELSARPVYQARKNRPGEGMWQQDLFEILSKPKACFEVQRPSNGLTESQIDAPYTETKEERATAEYYRANGYIFLDPTNIDEMARIISQGKAVHLLMFFTSKEYWREEPKLIEEDLTPDDVRSTRHGITGVDFFMYEGNKCLLIEDSASPSTTIDKTGQRIITEEFLKARCYGAGYLLFRKNEAEAIPKPKYKFTKPLTYGMWSDKDIVALQDILKYEGLFPLNIPSTGNMLQITCGALKKWQVKHGIMDFANEPDVRRVRFGPRSIALANERYK